jgi:hypothetical protein
MKFNLSSSLLFLPLVLSSVAAQDPFQEKVEGTITLGAERPVKEGPEAESSYCDGIKWICDKADRDHQAYRHLREICYYLEAVGYLTSNTIGNPDKSYTVFLATNEGVDRLWYDQYDFEPGDKIDKQFVKDILNNNIVKESYLQPEDIICRDSIFTINKSNTKPKVVCKEDILGGMAPFIKGPGNRAKIYLPRFIDPSDNWECDKDIGYEMDNVILYDQP